jgi:membrane protein required for colicin V production
MKVGFAVSQLGWIDLGLLIAIVGGAVIGFTRGLTDQIARFVAILITIVVTLHYYERVAALITQNSAVPPVFALMTTFFLIATLSNVVAKLFFIVLTKLLTVQFVYFLERIVGSFLGAIRFVLLFSLISVFISLPGHPVIEKLYKEQSFSGPTVMKICTYVHDYSVYCVKAISSGFDKEIKS